MTESVPVTVADAMRLIERYGNARRGSIEETVARLALFETLKRWQAAGEPGVSLDLRVIRPDSTESARLIHGGSGRVPDVSEVHIDGVDNYGVRWHIVTTGQMTVERTEP